MAKYYSTKTYNTDRGLSCCFRQWRATHSHCSLLHGYSIGVRLIFECTELDERNWCMDFGGLKDFKKWLEDMFDHTTLIANDDPELSKFTSLHKAKLLDLRIVAGVGCEKFAELCYNNMDRILTESKAKDNALNPTVSLKSVEVFEHGANSAIYEA